MYEIYHLTNKQDSISKSGELLEFLFDKRQEHYFKTVDSLGSSINRLALLVLIALLLLYFQPSDIELFGVKIPNLAVYIVLPVCILYYWLLFGFSLFNAIASRESLFHLTGAIEKNYFVEHTGSVTPVHSSKSSLEDISIVDAWSNVFLGFYENDLQAIEKDKQHRARKLNMSNLAVAVGLFVIFGGLQALAMGCSLSMIFFYKKRFTGDPQKRIIVFEVLLFSYFLLSHITFFITMPYSSLYLSSIWLIAALFFQLTLKPLKRSAVRKSHFIEDIPPSE